MADIESEASKLFEAYSRRSNAAIQPDAKIDPLEFAAVFASYFIGVSPVGVVGGPNDSKFPQNIVQGFQHYRKIGGTRFEIVGIDVERLDDLNALVKADWEFDYRRPADGKSGTIAFRNIYFVTLAEGEAKIFAWITPDERKAMAEHGLL